jgi:hypothetical protein
MLGVAANRRYDQYEVSFMCYWQALIRKKGIKENEIEVENYRRKIKPKNE